VNTIFFTVYITLDSKQVSTAQNYSVVDI